MRVRMDSSAYFLFLAEMCLRVTTSSAAFSEAYNVFEDSISPPQYRLRGPAGPADWRPEMNFAYTEVMTPYYHYYFYAPSFEKSPRNDYHLLPAIRDYYLPPYKARKAQIDSYYIAQDRNPSFLQNSGNEYYSPKFNDVGYPIQETYARNHPKLNRNGFLEKPFFNMFNVHEHRLSSENPHSELTPSFLPTVLSSGTPNIIRKDDSGRALQDSTFRPYSYAPTFKNHSPNPEFDSYSRSFKTALNPSLFSSAAPNVIRDRVPSINKLFKPISTTHVNNHVPSRNPASSTPLYPFPTQSSIDGNQYHPFSSPSSSVSPVISSIRPPLSFPTSDLPDYSVEETLSPVFTPGPTSLEGLSTPTPLDPTPYPDLSTTPPERPRILFEAPGRTQPRRR